MAWLIDVTGYRLIPAYFLIGTSVIGLVVVTVWLTETSGRALRGSAPAVEQKREIPEILQEPEEALWWQEEQARIAEQGDHPHSDRNFRLFARIDRKFGQIAATSAKYRKRREWYSWLVAY